MKFYLAPMEGITGYRYRGLVHRFFGEGVDKYFTPFFAPHAKRKPGTREMQEVLLKNNPDVFLVPQILTDSAKDFLRFEKDMSALGYKEVNLNAGCPSGTVTAGNRGSGLLKDISALDNMLYDIFAGCTGRVSVKTRLGYKEPEEFYELLDIYNKYPMCELIIHPRVREEFYKGRPHTDIFEYALLNTKNDLCWSGDICSVADYDALLERLPKSDKLTAIMLGRGMIADPSLIRQLAGGERATRQEIYDFVKDIRAQLREGFPDERQILDKQKELWGFMIKMFPGQEKNHKRLLKSRDLDESMAIQKEIIFKGDFLLE